MARKKKKVSQKREIWALVCVVLAVFICISFFTDAVVLKFIRTALLGLFGYGTYMLPIALVFTGFLLFFRKNNTLRIVSVMVGPVIMSAFFHCFLYRGETGLNISDLYTSGVLSKSAGAVSGAVTEFLAFGLSYIGAGIILFALLFVDLFLIFNLEPRDVYEMVFGYDKDDAKYKAQQAKVKKEKMEAIKARTTEQILEKEIQKEVKKEVKKEAKEQAKEQLKNRRFNIDISLDDDRNLEKNYNVADYEVPEVVEEKPSENEILEEAVKLFEEEIVFDADYMQEPQLDLEEIKEVKEEDSFIEEDVNDIDVFVRGSKKVHPKPISTPLNDEGIKESIKTEVRSDLGIKKEGEYIYPPLNLLNLGSSKATNAAEELKESSERLIDTLKSFNIDAEIINIIRGPSVTRFEMQISRGTKFSKITSLSDDIALALGAMSVRIAAIPDKLAIGIEVPNKSVQTVFIREVLSSKNFTSAESMLSFAVGKDITGNCIIGDVAKMPHMLIAGTTGSGKSVCINSILLSILYKASPKEVRLIMIDPKMIELGGYNGIPHLLIPVVTDPKKAAGALNWAVMEMMKRYKLFSEEGVRNLESYNESMKMKQSLGEEVETLPQIVIVIDELADLMMVAAREVEEAICRIAQMARAAGMHLIIATQRPSADVITGIMKANIPSRIAFAVASQIESRIILDQTGAEKLIGKGDMLYSPLGLSKPVRVQGCFLSNEEVNRVIDHIKEVAQAEYSEDIMAHIENQASADSGGKGSSIALGDDEDAMLGEAIEIAVDAGQISVSLIQRKLKLGYARAARVVDQMEDRGIIGPFEGSKPRQVLISREDWQEMTLRRDSKDF